MPELTTDQIEQIALEIRKQEISFSHLADELVDHLCCVVEDEMSNGHSFADAFKKVKQNIGPRRLREIQEETLYAIDTKYRIMKNIMKISGVAGTIMVGIGAMLKIQHFPGSGILLTLGTLILAVFFLPTSLGVLWKETHNKKNLFLFVSAFISGVLFIFGTLFKIQHWPSAGILVILAAFSAIFLFIPALLVSKLQDPSKRIKRPVYIIGAAGIIFWVAGMMFKINHWPYASLLMLSGVITVSFVALPFYTWMTWKDENNVDPRFIFIVLGTLLIIVPAILINLNLQGRFSDNFYSHVEQQQLLYNYKYNQNLKQIGRYQDSANFPLIAKIHRETAGLLRLVGDIQVKMVMESEAAAAGPAQHSDLIIPTDNGPEINVTRLKRPFDRKAVMDLLSPKSAGRTELEKALSEYVKSLATLTSDETITTCRAILDPAAYMPAEGSNPEGLLSGLHSLELLKNGILTAESDILRALTER